MEQTLYCDPVEVTDGNNTNCGNADYFESNKITVSYIVWKLRGKWWQTVYIHVIFNLKPCISLFLSIPFVLIHLISSNFTWDMHTFNYIKHENGPQISLSQAMRKNYSFLKSRTSCTNAIEINGNANGYVSPGITGLHRE